jgi:cytochrome c-type biogenesis protein CcmH/NrfF
MNIGNLKINIWMVSTLVLGLVLIVGFFKLFPLETLGKFGQAVNNSANVLVAERVSAKEISPLFECPCCGKAIDDCSCPMAKERMNYLDALIEVGNFKSKNEVILAYVKKYGLDSFIDKEKAKEFKEILVQQAPKDRPVIVLSPSAIDLGNVSQKQGLVTTLFDLKNEGKTDLVIERLETSCGCTSASIVFQGKEGPLFNMPGHGINEKIGPWQLVIKPGQSAQLKVYYDPNFHEDFKGFAIREIYVFSNDPINFKQKVRIELNQVD